MQHGEGTGGQRAAAQRSALPITQAEPTVAELRTITERLLLAVLREQDFAEQRQRAEDALRALYDEERRIRTVVEHVVANQRIMLDQLLEGILITDIDGRIVYTNAAARDILGLPPGGDSEESQASMVPLDLSPREPAWSEQPALSGPVQESEPVRSQRRRVRRRDGREVVTEELAVSLFDASGMPSGSVLVIRDVTAQTELEGQHDEFLVTVVHDLQNPLTAIRGFSQLLSRRAVRGDAPPGDAWLAHLGYIEQAATTMSIMIDDLLELGQLKLGQTLTLKRQPTDLVALTRRVVTDHQYRSDYHRLTLICETDALVGHWDAARLERALTNLLSNSIKYSPAGSEVVVRLASEQHPTGDLVALSVTDQGIGIPADELPHIFDHFWRGIKAAGRIAGTGLGLVSAKHIAEQHGGTLTVTSVEGRGSTFTLRLPLLAPDRTALTAR